MTVEMTPFDSSGDETQQANSDASRTDLGGDAPPTPDRQPREEGDLAPEAPTSPPAPLDLWPRPPFYLRFPWILAGPLVVAMILWFGSGAVLSATIAAPRSGSAPQAAAAKIQATVPPAKTTAAPAPATATPAPVPVLAAPTATPEVTATSKPTPFPLAVFNTDGQGVFLNRTAGGGDRIKGWPDRTILQVIGEDQQMYGQRWRNVRDPDGNEGWVLAQYLVNPTSLPAPAAIPTDLPSSPTPAATATATPAAAAATATPAAPTSTPAPTRAPATPAPTAASTAPALPASPTPRP